MNLAHFVPLDVENNGNMSKKDEGDECCENGGDDFNRKLARSQQKVLYSTWSLRAATDGANEAARDE